MTDFHAKFDRPVHPEARSRWEAFGRYKQLEPSMICLTLMYHRTCVQKQVVEFCQKNFRRHLYFAYFDTKMSINCILDSLISQTRKFHGGKIVV